MGCRSMDYFLWVESTRIAKPLDVRLENARLVKLEEIAKEVKVVAVRKEELIAVKAIAYTR